MGLTGHLLCHLVRNAIRIEGKLMLRYVLGKEVCERDECDAKSVS